MATKIEYFNRTRKAMAERAIVTLALLQHGAIQVGPLQEAIANMDLDERLFQDGQFGEAINSVVHGMVECGRLAHVGDRGTRRYRLVPNEGPKPRGKFCPFVDIDNDFGPFIQIVLKGHKISAVTLRRMLDIGGDFRIGKAAFGTVLQNISRKDMIQCEIEQGFKEKRLYSMSIVDVAIPMIDEPEDEAEEVVSTPLSVDPPVAFTPPVDDELKRRIRALGQASLALDEAKERVNAKRKEIEDTEVLRVNLHAKRDAIVDQINDFNKTLDIWSKELETLAKDVEARDAVFLQASLAQQQFMPTMAMPVVKIERGGHQLFEMIKKYADMIDKRYGYAYTQPSGDPDQRANESTYAEIARQVRRKLAHWNVFTPEDQRHLTELTNEEVVQKGFKALIMLVDDLAMIKGASHELPWFHGREAVL